MSTTSDKVKIERVDEPGVNETVIRIDRAGVGALIADTVVDFISDRINK